MRRLAANDLLPQVAERFVHMVDASPLGDALAARFAAPGSLAAALPDGYAATLRGAVATGLFDGSPIDVPRVRALLFLLGDRQWEATAAAERWTKEVGQERWERMRRNLDGARDLRAQLSGNATAPRRRV